MSRAMYEAAEEDPAFPGRTLSKHARAQIIAAIDAAREEGWRQAIEECALAHELQPVFTLCWA